jgi:TatD DNase family protein
MYLTRNQAYRKVPWVRIPPSPPHKITKRKKKMLWIDTHCHLDAAEFQDFNKNISLAGELRAYAATKKVAHCVYPAVYIANFAAVRQLAHAHGDSYALGIHPLYVKDATEQDLKLLDAELAERIADPRLVAVGEIGLDFFVAELNASPLREKQIHFYREQLKLAKKYDLPVVVHVRRSADVLLKGLRDVAGSGLQTHAWRGIIHAFNGSDQQAESFIKLGFKLGFGGAMTFERALQLRHLAATLPLDALVLETDSPDMPPHWLYKTTVQRAAGEPQGRNEPAQLPRIAQVLADLRGISLEALSQAVWTNSVAALPKLDKLMNKLLAETALKRQ